MKEIKLDIDWDEDLNGWHLRIINKQFFIKVDDKGKEIQILDPADKRKPYTSTHVDARAGVSARTTDWIFESSILIKPNPEKIAEVKKYLDSKEIVNNQLLGIFYTYDYPGLHVVAMVAAYHSATITLDYPDEKVERFKTINLEEIDVKEFLNELVRNRDKMIKEAYGDDEGK
jgi:hypothetical protein